MAFILIGASIYLVSSLLGTVEDKMKHFERDIFHEYSGIHPELYTEYLKFKSEKNYTEALKAIEELALYATSDIMDEIHEKILKQESLFI